jgi:hypothetical protein
MVSWSSCAGLQFERANSNTAEVLVNCDTGTVLKEFGIFVLGFDEKRPRHDSTHENTKLERRLF